MAPRKITIVEVGPRDGFQMESQFIPTDTKVSIINQIARSGVGVIEATSFVHPAVIPQMKDASEVLRNIDRVPGVRYVALVPNVKGARNALQARADGVKIVLSVTESSNQRNLRMPVKESLRQAEEILRLAVEAGVTNEVVISVAFGCPYEGDVSDTAVAGLVATLTGIGFREISIADSVGVANPASVRHISSMLLRQFPQAHFSLHFHNTRGLGLANVLAGMEAGIDQFDSSIGGLGGCPIVKGGIGNVTTEDLVNMLNEMSVECGVSLDAILQAARMAQDFLKRPLSSYLLAAGTRQNLYERNRHHNPNPVRGEHDRQLR